MIKTLISCILPSRYEIPIGWTDLMCSHFVHRRGCKNIWCRFPDGYLGLWFSANHFKHPGFHIVQHSPIVYRGQVLEIAFAICPVCEVLIIIWCLSVNKSSFALQLDIKKENLYNGFSIIRYIYY